MGDRRRSWPEPSVDGVVIPISSPPQLHASTSPWRVAWSRGSGCQSVADALGEVPALALHADQRRGCVEERIDVLVARRLTNFDLVPVIVPHEVDLTQVSAVTAAVSGGPHSDLAAAVAARLAARLELPVEIATLYRSQDERPEALARLERIAEAHDILNRRAFEAPAVAALVDELAPSTLLVLGAPGGSWLQRQFFGPGQRLTVKASGGALVVRSAPRRCFHVATHIEGRVAGLHLTATEALRLFPEAVIPVAESGRLVGIVRMETLRTAPGDREVGDLMEPPVAVDATEELAAAIELYDFLDGGPIPVVDESGMLVGTIAATEQE